VSEAALEAARFAHGQLRAYATVILERLDVPPEDACQVADCLIAADLRGVDSHGLIRLPVYARRVQANVVKARPRLRIEPRFSAVALVEGDNALGPVAGSRAMEEAIEIARTAGFGLVGVRHSNHFGIGAFYVEKAIRQGFIGCATSNAPPNMAPFGGRKRFLGTNPFAIGIPAGEEKALLFDASSSVAARGKIIAAAKSNRPIPEGWAIDPEGLPTTDAQAALAGAVLPFGGAKGSAISFLIDILCGVLTGASFANYLNTLENLSAEQNIGHLFAAIRTDIFMPSVLFLKRVDEIIRALRASPPAPGVPRVLVPGEPEMRTEARNRELGVPLANEVVRELSQLGDELGVPFAASERRAV
jgi:LDH2 family malate/lactate/ureidoglycolate dehydrogenase